MQMSGKTVRSAGVAGASLWGVLAQIGSLMAPVAHILDRTESANLLAQAFWTWSVLLARLRAAGAGATARDAAHVVLYEVQLPSTDGTCTNRPRQRLLHRACHHLLGNAATHDGLKSMPRKHQAEVTVCAKSLPVAETLLAAHCTGCCKAAGRGAGCGSAGTAHHSGRHAGVRRCVPGAWLPTLVVSYRWHQNSSDAMLAQAF